jgi:AcrR family transcriptional regulator
MKRRQNSPRVETTERGRSRSAAPKRAYHHGDLRAALVSNARRILHHHGLEALTLRAVARATGVSQTAPYRHFPDRRALMAAVAATGFRELHEAMASALEGGGGREGFKGVALAYVAFARKHPSLYRVMFGPEVANTEDLPELREVSRAALGFVQHGVAQLQAAGAVRAGDPAGMALALWASLHGLVLLILDGQAATVTQDIDALVAATAHLVMFGLAPRGAEGPGDSAVRPPPKPVRA